MDVHGVNPPEFERNPEKCGDWPFRFKQGIRAASLQAYTALVTFGGVRARTPAVRQLPRSATTSSSAGQTGAGPFGGWKEDE